MSESLLPTAELPVEAPKKSLLSVLINFFGVAVVGMFAVAIVLFIADPANKESKSGNLGPVKKQTIKSADDWSISMNDTLANEVGIACSRATNKVECIATNKVGQTIKLMNLRLEFYKGDTKVYHDAPYTDVAPFGKAKFSMFVREDFDRVYVDWNR